jgi:hypothetical protein
VLPIILLIIREIYFSISSYTLEKEIDSRLPVSHIKDCVICGNKNIRNKKLLFYEGTWDFCGRFSSWEIRDSGDDYSYWVDVEEGKEKHQINFAHVRRMGLNPKNRYRFTRTRKLHLGICTSCKNKKIYRELLSRSKKLIKHLIRKIASTFLLLSLMFVTNLFFPQVFLRQFEIFIRIISICSAFLIAIGIAGDIFVMLPLLLNSDWYYDEMSGNKINIKEELIVNFFKQQGRELISANAPRTMEIYENSRLSY